MRGKFSVRKGSQIGIPHNHPKLDSHLHFFPPSTDLQDLLQVLRSSTFDAGHLFNASRHRYRSSELSVLQSGVLLRSKIFRLERTKVTAKIS